MADKDFKLDEINDFMSTDGAAFEDKQEGDAFEAAFNDDVQELGAEATSSPEEDDNQDDQDQVDQDQVDQRQADQSQDVKPPVAEEPEQDVAPAPAVDPIAAMEARIRKMEGRVGNMTNQVQQLKTTPSAPTINQINAAANSNKKFEALKNEFPEWADAIEEQSKLTENRVLGQLPDFNQLQQQQASQMGTIANQARQMAIIDIKHPEWENTVQTGEFNNWLAVQKPEVQLLAESDYGSDAVKMLDLYTDSIKAQEQASAKKATKSRRLEQAVAPTKGAARPAARAMSEEEAFEKGFSG